MKDKINILFITDGIWYSYGAEKHLFYLTKHLNRKRFNCFILVFFLKGFFVEEFRKQGVEVFYIPINRIYTPDVLLKALKIRGIIKKNEIDIVQTYHFKSDTYGVLVSKLSGINHIISSRRDVGDKKRKRQLLVNRIMNRWIDKFITVCDAVGERITKDENISRSRQKTIYNGVELNKFEAPPRNVILTLRKKFGMGEKDFVVGMVANFRPEKSYDVFLRSVEIVKKSVQNLKVLAIGGGPTLESCKQYSKKNGMDDYITFTGRVDDVRDYIAVMDVACLVPGRNEGFSNAILEKMAMGKPLIVTDVGGNAEAVLDGVNGMVIAPFDHAKLAEAMIFLFKDTSKREEMGKKCRKRVEQFFTIKNMINNHETLYEEIINEKY